MNFALIACIGIPFISACFLRRTKTNQAMAWLSWVVTTLVFGLSIYIFYKTRTGLHLNHGVLGLRADMLSSTFNLLSALAWWAVSFYLPEYMKQEQRIKRFYLFFLVTLGAVQGIFLAGNWITLLAFFEIMTITSFFWVIHSQKSEAMKAGYFYLFLGVAAGLLIAVGLVFLNALGIPMVLGVSLSSLINNPLFYWAVAFLIAGFGIKAGMVPLHIWLPMAHPVAPSPGSALLSGIIIKCGVYGLLRITQLINISYIVGNAGANVGLVVIILGILTMLLGVSLALLQSNAKRLLAYHSISQVGYVILGIGVAIYLGANGGYGLSGAIYHAVNHGLYKTALFLGVGVIYLRTGEQDLYKMGGLWRRFPVTAFLMLIAVFGITGIPGLNGYASKTLLHHGVSEIALLGTPFFIRIERLFNLVGVGTTASFAKLYYLAFLQKPHPELEVKGSENSLLVASMGVLSVVMFVFGLRPLLFLNSAIIPALASLGVEQLGHLASTNFWSGPDLLGMVITLVVGIAFCAIGLKTGLFHWHPPTWLSIEAFGRGVVLGLSYIGITLDTAYNRTIAFIKVRFKQIYARLLGFTARLDTSGYGSSGRISFSNINFDVYLLLIAFAILIIYILF